MTNDREHLVDTVRAAVAEKNTEETVLQAAVRLIDAYSEGFHWTGFYMMRDGALEVGPYIGPETPHKRIELGQGICGAAATKRQSIVVEDVNADPRFLACSLTTKSEIVVPLMDGEECLGEIDIDSNNPAYFTDDDRRMLEQIAAVVVTRLKEIRKSR